MRQTASTLTNVSQAIIPEEGYDQFEQLILNRSRQTGGQPLFTTTIEEGRLWAAYLNKLPAERRQHYDCRCCRRFIESYGGLVTITEQGNSIPLLWGSTINTPEFFASAEAALVSLVLGAKVSGVFLSGEKTWGTLENVPGPGSKYVGQRWTHLSGVNTAIYKNPLKTAEQAMAKKREDYKTLRHGLSEYNISHVQQAVWVLESDALANNDKALGIAKWLLDLYTRLEGVKGQIYNNLIWLAVATAPPGFCHIRSTLINTMLEDIKEGKSFETIKRKWQEKTHPLQYRRRTTLETGNIEQAEKIIDKLGTKTALNRRFAKLEDVQHWLWRPRTLVQPAAEENKGGVFDHLRKDKKPAKEIELPPQLITFRRFLDEVLPKALEMNVYIPYKQLPFAAFVTAVDPTAPPIIQWDEDEKRNPVSWYMYHKGSPATNWNVLSGSWVKANGLTYMPHMWMEAGTNRKYNQHQRMALFTLDGCRDVGYSQSGLFFPDMLRNEYHSIRSVMEAYSNNGVLAGKEEATACGLAVQEGIALDFLVRVKTEGGLSTYRIDRWE
jgi:hypothetical protein